MLTAVALVVVLTVVIAHHIGVIGQGSGGQCFRRRIRITVHAAIQLDTCRRQCRLGTAADTAADQRVHMQRAQNARQRAVAAAVGIHHFRGNDVAVFHIVDLELLRVAKVLKNFSVFVSDRNSHDGFSFWLCILLIEFLLIAIAPSALPVAPVAKLIVSALDPQRQAVHQHVRQFFSGVGIVLPSFFVILLVMNLLRGILKGKYAQAVLQGLKPCMIGIILATGVYMTLHNCFPLVQGAKADLRALLIVVVLAACMAMYRTLKKKKLSPILLIIASAMLGILIY